MFYQNEYGQCVHTLWELKFLCLNETDPYWSRWVGWFLRLTLSGINIHACKTKMQPVTSHFGAYSCVHAHSGDGTFLPHCADTTHGQHTQLEHGMSWAVFDAHQYNCCLHHIRHQYYSDHKLKFTEPCSGLTVWTCVYCNINAVNTTCRL